ncbi:MAG TPA: RHS repeat-associated core domain-containing protein [Phycisphaerales bacterium]|nr:RHS repeat-associated core domain-containing protein [Phycisphaerales bacterium]
MNRSPLAFLGVSVGSALLLAHAALADPVLTNNGNYMTATQLVRTTRQDALPLWWNRGADLEGGIRFGGDGGVPASPGFNSGMGAATMGGIDLASLGFSMSEVDMALPTNGPAVVIGRSFNHRQGSDTSVAASNGLQGYNWFQSVMPEIVVYSGGSANDDVVYLVYGANRFMEFHESATTGKFKGMNGTTGVVEKSAGNGTTTYDTYTITDQNGWQWVFWGGNTASNKANWQLWKKTDPQGLTVYAGDKTTHTTAVTNGYATGGGVSTLYQEFGDPSSPTERRYLFTYTAVSSVDRLTQVSAQIKTSGTWASPTGLTEIGRVTYAYYTATTTHGTDANDYFGLAGDLKTVNIRTALTDSGTGSGTDLGSGIYDDRTKYYRYYGAAYNNSDNRRGHPHALKLVLGFEGARRYDYAGDSTFDATYNDSTEATSALKEYSDAYYEYESSSSTQRIASAFFNGECGSGGGADGSYDLAYDASARTGTYRGNTSYDTAWCTRTTVTQPDSTYQVRYFDELGQPLSTVVTTSTGGSTHWITGIDRDSSGRVTTIHSPANLSTYTHSTGAITYLSSSSTGGLITNLGRVASGDRTGLIESTGFQTGTGGSNQLLTETTFSQRDASVAGGSLTLSKPVVATTKAYWGTGGSDYDTTTYTFAWWSATTTSPLYVTPKSVTTTLPAVATAHNGENATHDSVSYLRKDGRTAFTVATDGVYTAMKYNEMGLPVRTVRDADPATSGDFDTNYGPGDYGLSTSTNSGLAYPSAATYDSVGRTVTSVARPDGSTPVKRTAETYYSKLADGRLATLSFPRQASPGGTLTFYGPASYSVSNHAGRSEFACTLGTSSTTATKANWLDETYADPIDALENASANLGASSRANIFGISTTIYNTSGSKVSESRTYHTFATSSTWTGSAGTNYDRTEYAYDTMGRAHRVKDPTDTITRTVFDALGRQVSRWVGTIDTNGWTSTGNGSGDNMTQLEVTEYDSAGVGNGHVTKRTAYVSGDNTTGVGTSGTKRETTFLHDIRGRTIVTINPLAPHSVTNYDLRGRPTASAMYSSSSGLTAATNGAATGTVSNRVALSTTFYDSRGQVYKSVRWKIDQSDGSDDDSLDALTWRDAAGRVIKQGGTSHAKTIYDRLGRVRNTFELARDNDSGYSDADDVSGDIVLQQSDTVYDNVDRTGLVMMTATIMRNWDDTSTTGALDTNADNDIHAYDQTGTPDVKGRIQITAYWYDELDRQQDTVQYGTYAYADFDRQPSSAWLTVPARSATALRTTTVYNDNGTVQATKAPKEVGGTPLESRTLYDQGMRRVAEVRNYVNGTPSGVTGDDDVYTRSTYDDGLLKTVWVDFDGDDVVDTDDQVTTYTYGTTKGTTASTSRVKDNRLLDNVLYPAQGYVGETTAERSVYFAYNAQGQKHYQKDNNGTELEYTYDTLGRKTGENTAALGSGVDSSIKDCTWVYNSRGLLETVTQGDSGGDEADQVLYKYDDWGNLTDFRQDYDDVVTNTSPNDLGVKHTYTKVDTTSPTSGTRRSGIRRTATGLYYGSGTTGAGTKHYEVSSTFDNTSFGATLYDADAGRVTSMTRSYPTSSILTNLFRYGGSGVLVQNYLAESAVANNMASGGTTGWDDSMDRFGRATRRMWRNGSSGGTYYKVEPAYDQNSNITAAENIWVTPWSSTYESDGLNRLKELEFGIMTTGAISTVVQKEDWHASGTLKLDQVGNWIDYTRTREGASQDAWAGNTFTKINTYTKFEKGATDVEPEYNPKGLPTKDDKTVATTKGYRYTFDAWDRLVTVKDTSNNLVAEYRYNGLGHRIGWHYDENASGATDGSDDWFYFQYNERWQQVGMWRAGDTAPTEVFVYLNAGRDGFGGSSYIDDCVLRERDTNANGTFDDRYYYLQNWRHDVVCIMNYDGAVKERLTYDAYGRPHAFSPGDVKTAGGADRPDGTLDANDTWTTGSVLWNKDLGNASGVAIPNGVVDANDGTTLTNLKTAGYSAGYGLLSTAAVDNRKGYAGYEFDTVLQGSGHADEKPIYHVRHRVLASDTGKWLQKDPLGYHDSMDLYEYCRSDAVDAQDPLGLACNKNAPVAVTASSAPASTKTIFSVSRALMFQTPFDRPYDRRPQVLPDNRYPIYGPREERLSCEWSCCVERLSPMECLEIAAISYGYYIELPGADNELDALRHCSWQCTLACHFRESAARRVGNCHEKRSPSRPGSDEMDQWNNMIGRGLGQACWKRKITLEDCASCCGSACSQALASGLLSRHPYDDPFWRLLNPNLPYEDPVDGRTYPPLMN